MSTNVSRQRSERALIETVSGLKSNQQQVRTPQVQGTDTVNIHGIAFSDHSFTVPANSTWWLWAKFENSEGKIVFGTLEYTLYQGSKAVGNEINAGDSNVYWQNWDVWMAPSYYDSTDSILMYHFIIKNLTAGDLAMVFTGRIRAIVSGGTTT